MPDQPLSRACNFKSCWTAKNSVAHIKDAGLQIFDSSYNLLLELTYAPHTRAPSSFKKRFANCNCTIGESIVGSHCMLLTFTSNISCTHSVLTERYFLTTLLLPSTFTWSCLSIVYVSCLLVLKLHLKNVLLFLTQEVLNSIHQHYTSAHFASA